MRLTISKKDVLCFVLLLSPLEPRFFELNAMIQRIYTMVMFFSAAYLGIQYLKNRRRPANVALIIVLLQVWLLLSTVLNHGLINSTVIRCVKFFVLCLTVDYFSDDLSRLLRCLMLHFEIYTYSNLVAYILFPGGLVTHENYAGGVSAEWVLGWHHYFKIWFIPGLLVAWLYRDYFKKSKRCYLLTAAIIITESFWGASTGLTGAILFVILLIIPKIKSILTTFSEFSWMDVEDALSCQGYEDYKSRYLTLYDYVKKERNADKVSILDDIDFAIEVIQTDKINVTYIMNLLRNVDTSNKKQRAKDLEHIKQELDRTDNPELRRKVDLIRAFIDRVMPTIKQNDSIDEAFANFESEQRNKEIEEFANKQEINAEFLKQTISDYEFSNTINKKDIITGIDRPIKFKEKHELVAKIIQFIKENVFKYQ